MTQYSKETHMNRCHFGGIHKMFINNSKIWILELNNVMYIKCQRFTYDYQSLFVVCDGSLQGCIFFPQCCKFLRVSSFEGIWSKHWWDMRVIKRLRPRGSRRWKWSVREVQHRSRKSLGRAGICTALYLWTMLYDDGGMIITRKFQILFTLTPENVLHI